MVAGLPQRRAAAGAVGPFVGGGLVDGGWRWAFLINIPVAAAAVVCARVAVPETRDPHAARGLDLGGAMLAVVALAASTWALTEAGVRGWTDTAVLVAGAITVGATVSFVRHQRHTHDPLVPPSLFRDRTFMSVASGVNNAVARAASLGALAVVPVARPVGGKRRRSPTLSGSDGHRRLRGGGCRTGRLPRSWQGGEGPTHRQADALCRRRCAATARSAALPDGALIGSDVCRGGLYHPAHTGCGRTWSGRWRGGTRMTLGTAIGAVIAELILPKARALIADSAPVRTGQRR